MKTTRRGFFGLLAGAVAAKFLPAPAAHIPMVGDIIFLDKNGVWIQRGKGPMTKLSRECTFEGLQYNALGVASVGSYAGISRAPLPPNARFNKSMRLIDDYFKRRQHGQQRQD